MNRSTKLLTEAHEAMANELQGAQWTMHRVSQIQGKMSQCMTECLAEFNDLFLGSQSPAQPDLSGYGGNVPQQEPIPLGEQRGAINSLPRILDEMRRSGALKG